MKTFNKFFNVLFEINKNQNWNSVKNLFQNKIKHEKEAILH